jgi:phosphatidylglycerol lysyltransferase
VLDALRRHGWTSTSFQILESDFLIWEDSQGQGLVGYVDTGAAWVAGGEPIADPEQVAAVARRFFAAAAAANRRVCCFATEGRLAELPGMHRLLLGEQPVWDPAAWPDTLATARSLRAQLRRARSHGVTIRRVDAAAVATGTPLRIALEALVHRWRASRTLATMGFLVQVEPFGDLQERLLFVAEQSGRPVALLSMAPIFARDGWLFEDLLRDPSAPNGTTELLVDAGMRAIAERGSGWATLGLAPLAGPVSPWLARVRRWATPFFNFEGLTQFKAKLRPASWAPIWMVHPAHTPTWRALLDALTAFAGGSVLRYGWRTLRRGPRPVLAAMAALLVPWTLALALLDTVRWYPAPWMQTGWVTFDLALCATIGALAHRWRQPLGVAVASAVTADVLVTTWQAITWYVPRASGTAEYLGTLTAISAPTLAAFVLWGRVQRGVHMHSAPVR